MAPVSWRRLQNVAQTKFEAKYVSNTLNFAQRCSALHVVNCMQKFVQRLQKSLNANCTFSVAKNRERLGDLGSWKFRLKSYFYDRSKVSLINFAELSIGEWGKNNYQIWLIMTILGIFQSVSENTAPSHTNFPSITRAKLARFSLEERDSYPKEIWTNITEWVER